MCIDVRRLAIVVAHPDDETIGCGALLSCLQDVVIVVVTDGAPRDLRDAHAAGFATAAAYAAARRRELTAALKIAGCRADIVMLGLPDQQAALKLAPLARQIAAILRRSAVSTVVTHAYEGGHPDHDAAAFAAHRAVRLLAREGQSLSIVELPLYRLGPDGLVLQQFAEPADRVLQVRLSSPEQARKRRMIAAYGTQQATLAAFSVATEAYRSAPEYDFLALPNEGRLFYERHPWGMTGRRWLTLTAAAERDLQRHGLADSDFAPAATR